MVRLTDRYMNERVPYGGELRTRAEVIRDLYKCVPADHPNPDALVGRFMVTLDRARSEEAK